MKYVYNIYMPVCVCVCLKTICFTLICVGKTNELSCDTITKYSLGVRKRLTVSQDLIPT